MLSSLPPEILNDSNREVLDFIKDLSAHDGVASELANAVKPLGDVQVYCPDPGSYRYVVTAYAFLVARPATGDDALLFGMAASAHGMVLLGLHGYLDAQPTFLPGYKKPAVVE